MLNLLGTLERHYILRWRPKMAQESLCLLAPLMSQSNRLDTAARRFGGGIQRHYDGRPERMR